jgi:NAD(P)-dependent dehydrogenase (short-subunit alcohol dehydrogenase family)
MQGRTCVVTGATSGIGYETARALLAQGARLVVVARSRTKADDAVARMVAATGRQDVTVVLGDLAVQAEVRRVASELLACCPQLDVLVNNAGVVNLQRRLTVDGIEETLAVNHLGYYLLTRLLLDRLIASAPSRIVNVASDAHRFGRVDLDDLNSAHRYRAMRVYGMSKGCNILFTYELARRLAGTGVTVNCCHPGAVRTGLGHNNGPWAGTLSKLVGVFFRTPAQGAATSIRLATAPELAAVTGQYFANEKPKRSAAATYDAATKSRLWDESARLTGLPA